MKTRRDFLRTVLAAPVLAWIPACACKKKPKKWAGEPITVTEQRFDEEWLLAAKRYRTGFELSKAEIVAMAEKSACLRDEVIMRSILGAS